MIDESLKKSKLCVTVNPGIKMRVMDEYEAEHCSSASDLVNTALIEFFARRDAKKEHCN